MAGIQLTGRFSPEAWRMIEAEQNGRSINQTVNDMILEFAELVDRLVEVRQEKADLLWRMELS